MRPQEESLAIMALNDRRRITNARQVEYPIPMLQQPEMVFQLRNLLW